MLYLMICARGAETVSLSDQDLQGSSFSQPPQEDGLIHTVIGALDIKAHQTEFALAPRIVYLFD
jgi:hypothetical protein